MLACRRSDAPEARDSFKNVDCNIHVNTSVSRHRSDGNFEVQNTSPKVQLPGHREMDFLDVNSPACNRVETVPFRHVSFAETVEKVEFDPAVHAALSPVIEHNASAPNMAYRVHAAPAPMVEYDAALMMAQQAHVTPASAVEYDASAARAAPPPLVDGPVVKVVHVPQVQVVEKTIEIPQLQTIGKIVDILEVQSVQSTQTSESLDIITPAPKEFVETVLHEIDEDLCRDDLEEICYVARMSRKRIWRRVWHGSFEWVKIREVMKEGFRNAYAMRTSSTR